MAGQNLFVAGPMLEIQSRQDGLVFLAWVANQNSLPACRFSHIIKTDIALKLATLLYRMYVPQFFQDIDGHTSLLN